MAAIVAMGVTLLLQERLDHAPAFRDTVYGKKFNALTTAMRDRGSDRPLVFFGSSRVDNGFRAIEAEQRLDTPAVTMNFGFAGAGPLLTTIYADRLAAAGLRPGMVLIECLPSLLHHRDEGPAETVWFTSDRFTTRERASWQAVAGPSTTPTVAVRNPWELGRIALLAKSFPWLLSNRRRQTVDQYSDARGWNPYPFTTRTDDERRRGLDQARREHGSNLSDLRLVGHAAESMTKLARRWGDTPVRIVLMPESTEFRDFYGPHTEHAILDYLITLNVPWIDARDWVPDHLFADGHHLLPDGATIFTDRLMREVRP